MTKRILATVLAVVLLVGGLSGCTGAFDTLDGNTAKIAQKDLPFDPSMPKWVKWGMSEEEVRKHLNDAQVEAHPTVENALLTTIDNFYEGMPLDIEYHFNENGLCSYRMVMRFPEEKNDADLLEEFEALKSCLSQQLGKVTSASEPNETQKAYADVWEKEGSDVALILGDKKITVIYAAPGTIETDAAVTAIKLGIGYPDLSLEEAIQALEFPKWLRWDMELKQVQQGWLDNGLKVSDGFAFFPYTYRDVPLVAYASFEDGQMDYYGVKIRFFDRDYKEYMTEYEKAVESFSFKYGTPDLNEYEDYFIVKNATWVVEGMEVSLDLTESDITVFYFRES